MTNKKIIIIISLCLAGSMMLTACKVSGSNTSETTDASIIVAESSVAATTKEPTETAAATTAKPTQKVTATPAPTVEETTAATTTKATETTAPAVTTKATEAPAATTKAPTATTAAPAATTAAPPVETAAPTVPITSLSASEVESIVWGQVEAARAGMTTNHNEILSTRSRSNAARLYVGHTGNNGSLESCGSIGKGGSGKWTCQLYGNQEGFDTLEECVSALGNYLVTVHVPSMATETTYTEFGVGVAKEESGGIITYYIFISFASPEDLQCQIDMGWYA